MNEVYKKLNKKLERLQYTTKTKNDTKNTETTNTDIFPFYDRVVNLTNISFNTEELTLLQKGHQYNMETTLREWSTEAITDTETAIGNLEVGQQDIFRHIAQGKLHKMIQDAGYGNSLHKRGKHIARRIRKKLQEKGATIALADKGKTILIIHKTAYDDKINQFLTTPAAFAPQEFSWYSFLEAESTPGHTVLSAASKKIPNNITGDRSRDPPASSSVP
jgi:hypothetical protein